MRKLSLDKTLTPLSSHRELGLKPMSFVISYYLCQHYEYIVINIIIIVVVITVNKLVLSKCFLHATHCGKQFTCIVTLIYLQDRSVSHFTGKETETPNLIAPDHTTRS